MKKNTEDILLIAYFAFINRLGFILQHIRWKNFFMKHSTFTRLGFNFYDNKLSRRYILVKYSKCFFPFFMLR